MAKAAKKTVAKKQEAGKTAAVKKSAAQKAPVQTVDEFMESLKHPLKAEVMEVRRILKDISTTLEERMKWAAPSYYTTVDLVTFNLRNESKVHLVFHHIAIASITSPQLVGDYKDRRMMYFKNMDEVKAGEKELRRIMKLYIRSAG